MLRLSEAESCLDSSILRTPLLYVNALPMLATKKRAGWPSCRELLTISASDASNSKLPGAISAVCTKHIGGLRKADWLSDLPRSFVGRSAPVSSSGDEAAIAMKLHTQFRNEANYEPPDCTLIFSQLMHIHRQVDDMAKLMEYRKAEGRDVALCRKELLEGDLTFRHTSSATSGAGLPAETPKPIRSAKLFNSNVNGFSALEPSEDDLLLTANTSEELLALNVALAICSSTTREWVVGAQEESTVRKAESRHAQREQSHVAARPALGPGLGTNCGKRRAWEKRCK